MDGEFIVKNGELTKVDIRKTAPIINAQRDDLMERMGFDAIGSWPVE